MSNWRMAEIVVEVAVTAACAASVVVVICGVAWRLVS